MGTTARTASSSGYDNPPHNSFVAGAAGELAGMLPRWRETDVRVVIITGAVPDRPITALELGIVNELADDAKARAIEIAVRLAKASPVALTAAKRSIVNGANLPTQEGLRVEAEEWLKTMATQDAFDLMTDYVDRPFEERLDWVRDHGAWPEPGAATGA